LQPPHGSATGLMLLNYPHSNFAALLAVYCRAVFQEADIDPFKLDHVKSPLTCNSYRVCGLRARVEGGPILEKVLIQQRLRSLQSESNTCRRIWPTVTWMAKKIRIRTKFNDRTNWIDATACWARNGFAIGAKNEMFAWRASDRFELRRSVNNVYFEETVVAVGLVFWCKSLSWQANTLGSK